MVTVEKIITYALGEHGPESAQDGRTTSEMGIWTLVGRSNDGVNFKEHPSIEIPPIRIRQNTPHLNTEHPTTSFDESHPAILECKLVNKQTSRTKPKPSRQLDMDATRTTNISLTICSQPFIIIWSMLTSQHVSLMRKWYGKINRTERWFDNQTDEKASKMEGYRHLISAESKTYAVTVQFQPLSSILYHKQKK